MPGTDLGDVRSRVARQLAQAGRLLDRAEARCAKAKTRPAKRKLMKASRRLGRVVRVARPRSTGRALPLSVETFVGGATALVGDTRTLARGLACP
jgi:hypothetical protein